MGLSLSELLLMNKSRNSSVQNEQLTDYLAKLRLTIK